MDMTKEFRAMAKAAKVRVRATAKSAPQTTDGAGPAASDGPAVGRQKAKSRTKGGHQSRAGGGLVVRAQRVKESITELRNYLATHAKDYLGIGQFLRPHAARMTDAERDATDAEAQSFASVCASALHVLAAEVQGTVAVGDGSGASKTEHMLEVVASLNRYLQDVAVCHTALRDSRAAADSLAVKKPPMDLIQRELDRQAEAEAANEEGGTTAPASLVDETGDVDAENAIAAATLSKSPTHSFPGGAAQSTAAWASQTFADGGPAIAAVSEEVLTQELRQRTFEDDVLAAEARVAEVAKMQSQFATELANQSEMIEGILQDASTAQTNVHEGNKHLRKAMDDSATLRQSVVLFILMCSLILMVLELFGS